MTFDKLICTAMPTVLCVRIGLRAGRQEGLIAQQNVGLMPPGAGSPDAQIKGFKNEDSAVLRRPWYTHSRLR